MSQINKVTPILLGFILASIFILEPSSAQPQTCPSILSPEKIRIIHSGQFAPNFEASYNELTPPTVEWAKSGNHTAALARIYAEWITHKSRFIFSEYDFYELGEPLEITRPALREALSILHQNRDLLVQMAKRNLLMKTSGQTRVDVKFNSQVYTRLGRLSDSHNKEADVFLVVQNDNLFVLKQFVSSRADKDVSASEAFQAQINFFNALAESPLRIRRPLAVDREQNSMLFEYVNGLTLKALKNQMIGHPEMPVLLVESFRLVQTVFSSLVLHGLTHESQEVHKVANPYLLMALHSENTMYDPQNESWLIIDPF